MAATATITAAADRGPGRWARGPALVLAGVAGLSMIAYAAPRLVAAITALPARPVLWEAYAGRPVPLPDLLAAADTLGAAAARGSVTASGEQGYLLLRATRDAPLADQFGLLTRAEQASMTQLARAPGNPSLWLRLASLRERRGDMDGALAAWRMSVMTGGFEPVIMVDRLSMGARLVPRMDADTRSLLVRQIRNTWTLSWQYAEAVRAMPGMSPLVDQALDSLTEREMAAHTRNNGGPPPPRP